ncbi:MAG TPA: dihydrodipicolinate synthase family protein [Acidimicrobiales bacterium]|nr:dihydrodipicolinate synthase family protein [Acidimicrobiales bacterium]
MARAAEAREWAPDALRGIIDSLYTPFGGPGGEHVDEAALRALVRHCIGALDHDGIWVGGLVGEYWALTTEERKRLLEVAVEETRAIKPDALVEACPASTNVLETVELTRHAAGAGADICFVIPPYFEARGYEATRELLRYVTERTDMALGLFNTHAAGWILTPAECAHLADEFPAICAVKNGMFRPSHSAALHRLAPELVIWECDMLAYRGGFLRRGITTAGILGGSAYLYELPDNRLYSAQWDLLVSDKLSEAIDHWYDSGLDDLVTSLHQAFGASNVDAPYTHWGSAFKAAAAQLGLPVGDYPRSRPPQPPLPDPMKAAIRTAYETAGLL